MLRLHPAPAPPQRRAPRSTDQRPARSTPRARHGFSSNIAPAPPLWDDPAFVRYDESAAALAEQLGDDRAIVLRGNGAVTVGAAVEGSNRPAGTSRTRPASSWRSARSAASACDRTSSLLMRQPAERRGTADCSTGCGPNWQPVTLSPAESCQVPSCSWSAASDSAARKPVIMASAMVTPGPG